MGSAITRSRRRPAGSWSRRDDEAVLADRRDQPIEGPSSSLGGGARRGRCQRGGVGEGTVGSTCWGARARASRRAHLEPPRDAPRRTRRSRSSSRAMTSPSSPISTVGSGSASASTSVRLVGPSMPIANTHASTTRDAQAAHARATAHGRGGSIGVSSTGVEDLAQTRASVAHVSRTAACATASMRPGGIVPPSISSQSGFHGSCCTTMQPPSGALSTML